MKHCMTRCLSQILFTFNYSHLNLEKMRQIVAKSWLICAFLHGQVAVSIDYAIDLHMFTLQIRLIDLYLPISIDLCIPNWKPPTIEDCFAITKVWWSHAPTTPSFLMLIARRSLESSIGFTTNSVLSFLSCLFLRWHVTLTLGDWKKFTQVDWFRFVNHDVWPRWSNRLGLDGWSQRWGLLVEYMPQKAVAITIYRHFWTGAQLSNHLRYRMQIMALCFTGRCIVENSLYAHSGVYGPMAVIPAFKFLFAFLYLLNAPASSWLLILGSAKYRCWCHPFCAKKPRFGHTGVAFETRLASYSSPNRTLAFGGLFFFFCFWFCRTGKATVQQQFPWKGWCWTCTR